MTTTTFAPVPAPSTRIVNGRAYRVTVLPVAGPASVDLSDDYLPCLDPDAPDAPIVRRPSDPYAFEPVRRAHGAAWDRVS